MTSAVLVPRFFEYSITNKKMTMKKKLALALLGIAVVFSGTVIAQTTESPLSPIAESVKILPSSEKGIIRVLYASESATPVEIRFFTKDGELGSDKVFRKSYEKGFLKRYDISHINARDFLIEVSTKNSKVLYRIEQAIDRKSFEPTLEEVSYSEVLTASKKTERKN